MSDFNVTLAYRIIDCMHCGLQFGVPVAWDDQRRSDNKWLYCPNGHGQSYVKDEQKPAEPTPAQIELRRLHIKQLHDEEQAEARAAEGKTDAPVADPDTLHCLVCNRRWKRPGAFRRHMERIHRVDPCTLKPLQP